MVGVADAFADIINKLEVLIDPDDHDYGLALDDVGEAVGELEEILGGASAMVAGTYRKDSTENPSVEIVGDDLNLLRITFENGDGRTAKIEVHLTVDYNARALDAARALASVLRTGARLWTVTVDG